MPRLCWLHRLDDALRCDQAAPAVVVVPSQVGAPGAAAAAAAVAVRA